MAILNGNTIDANDLYNAFDVSADFDAKMKAVGGEVFFNALFEGVTSSTAERDRSAKFLAHQSGEIKAFMVSVHQPASANLTVSLSGPMTNAVADTSYVLFGLKYYVIPVDEGESIIEGGEYTLTVESDQATASEIFVSLMVENRRRK